MRAEGTTTPWPDVDLKWFEERWRRVNRLLCVEREHNALAGFADDPLPAYSVLYAWRHPVAYARWLWRMIGMTGRSGYFDRGYAETLWRLLTEGRRLRGGMPLPVLGNVVDAPCEGCGGHCCQVLPGKRGFTVVVVETWEHFAKVRPDLVEPSESHPAQLYFRFDKTPEGGYRCRFLRIDGKCGAYAYRPLACRNFSCTDGLNPRSVSCDREFLREVPEVRDRLLRLGYREVDHDRSFWPGVAEESR